MVLSLFLLLVPTLLFVTVSLDDVQNKDEQQHPQHQHHQHHQHQHQQQQQQPVVRQRKQKLVTIPIGVGE